MYAKEFAIKYAGRRVRVNSGEDNFVPNYDVKEAIVVGYFVANSNCSYLTVMAEEIAGWNKNGSSSIYQFWVRDVDTLAHSCYNIPLNENSDILINEPIISIKPYPHTCSHCSSPARKCKSMVLCSNVKCKSRRNVRKLIGKVSKPTYRLIMCPKCSTEAIGCNRIDKLTEIGIFNCLNGHKWNCNAPIGSAISQLNSVYVWSGWLNDACRGWIDKDSW